MLVGMIEFLYRAHKESQKMGVSFSTAVKVAVTSAIVGVPVGITYARSEQRLNQIGKGNRM